MPKNKMSDDDVIRRLNPPSFKSKDTDIPQDPLCKARIEVTIDELMPYDGNPRQSKNPKYAEIKASIFYRGLDHPPKVTRRDPGEKLMVKDGGNTRLEILHELWAETQDERFYRIEVDFEPWIDEIDALAGHMAENEQRGDLLFIEKANAAVRMRSMLEKQLGNTLSMRELAKQITETGWSLSAAHLTRFEYAANRLLPSLPTAFWAGAGEPAVKKLRKFEAAYSTYWRTQSRQDEAAFSVLYDQVLREHDDEELDFDSIQRALDRAVGNALGIDHQTVAVQCDALQFNRNLPPEALAPPAASTPPHVPGATAEPTPPDNGVDSVAQPSAPVDITQQTSRPVTSASAGTASVAEVATTPRELMPNDVAALRERCWMLACQVAKPYGIESLVLPIPVYYGYVVDAPRSNIRMGFRDYITGYVQTHEPDDALLRAICFDLLIGINAQTWHPFVAEHAPKGSHIYDILSNIPEGGDTEKFMIAYDSNVECGMCGTAIYMSHAPESARESYIELLRLQSQLYPLVKQDFLERITNTAKPQLRHVAMDTQ